LSLWQKFLSTEIPSFYPKESGGTGFPACADKGLNLRDDLDILYKEHLEKLRVFNAAPFLNPHLHRLGSLCHQSKMNFANASFGKRYKAAKAFCGSRLIGAGLCGDSLPACLTD
jgi:hypothetical protein